MIRPIVLIMVISLVFNVLLVRASSDSPSNIWTFDLVTNKWVAGSVSSTVSNNINGSSWPVIAGVKVSSGHVSSCIPVFAQESCGIGHAHGGSVYRISFSYNQKFSS